NLPGIDIDRDDFRRLRARIHAKNDGAFHLHSPSSRYSAGRSALARAQQELHHHLVELLVPASASRHRIRIEWRLLHRLTLLAAVAVAGVWAVIRLVLRLQFGDQRLDFLILVEL